MLGLFCLPKVRNTKEPQHPPSYYFFRRSILVGVFFGWDQSRLARFGIRHMGSIPSEKGDVRFERTEPWEYRGHRGEGAYRCLAAEG